jgi:HK97 family phage major capsid protein
MQPGWIFSPKLLNTLEKVKDTTGRYLAESELLTFDATGGTGTLLGYRFVTSGQIPTNLTRGTSTNATYLIFGSDSEEFWVGEEEPLTIELSAEAAYKDLADVWHSAFQERQTLFRAGTTHDAAPRRPQLFSVVDGVLV